MRIVESAVPGAQLVILGDGPLCNPLHAMAQSLLRNYQFIGVSDATAVRAWMEQASVVVVPSVIASDGDAEGFCMVACEAQAMQVPVVCFTGPGLSESVADGVTGLIVASRDEGALAEGILTLMRNEALARRMGVAGRRRVEQHFNLAHQTALLEAKYDKILGVPASASQPAEAS